MKSLIFILTLCTATTGLVFGQEPVDSKQIDKSIVRPHILYAEVMGRAPFWSVGYGFSFYQHEKHELNFTVGLNYQSTSSLERYSMIPIGIFYRFGTMFKVETGFTVTPLINWVRFTEGEFSTGPGQIVKIPDHSVVLVPSLGFVYGAKNGKIELGLRYTPLLDPKNLESSISYMFGVFLHFRLKGKNKKTTANNH